MKVQKILLPIIAVLGALVFFSVFIIKEVNQAIVLQFGDPKRIIVEPGLNFKIQTWFNYNSFGVTKL